MRNIYCRETNCIHYVRRFTDRHGRKRTKIGANPCTWEFKVMLETDRHETDGETGEEYHVPTKALADLDCGVVETRDDVYAMFKM